MSIHKSHSKKDLFNFINEFKIPIHSHELLTKSQLILLLTDAMASGLFYINENNKYLVKTEKDMNDYLFTCNPKKLLTVKDKKQLIKDCRRINQYSTNSFCINNTTFDSQEEVEELVIACSEYGDIPSVRKMLKKYNSNISLKNIIKPKISSIIQKELNDKQIIKKQYFCNLIIKQGPFTIVFN
tara:strand:+ start:1608 stop:2159 length:552 start_codon:yes stop_codon:yes gene_type:complete